MNETYGRMYGHKFSVVGGQAQLASASWVTVRNSQLDNIVFASLLFQIDEHLPATIRRVILP